MLEDGSLALYESTAIILHLPKPKAQHPRTGTRSASRSDFYRWLMWLATALHANLSLYLHPGKVAASTEAQADVKQSAEHRVDAQFDRVEAD